MFRFRERHGISWEVISGDQESADIKAAKMWTEEKLLEIVRSYKAEEFYNVDDTACCHRLLPERSMAYTGEKFERKISGFILL